MAHAAAGDGLRERVLAWMGETGSGLKSAAREFGVPRTTVQRWRRDAAAEKTRAEPVSDVLSLGPNANGPPFGPPSGHPIQEPSDREDWIAFLRRKISQSERAFQVAMEARHTSSMVRLQDLTVRYREKLELALQAREADERMGEDMPEPGQLAGDALRAVLADVAELARLQPELCRKVAAELEAAVGG